MEIKKILKITLFLIIIIPLFLFFIQLLLILIPIIIGIFLIGYLTRKMENSMKKKKDNIKVKYKIK